MPVPKENKLNKSSFYVVCLRYTPAMWQHMASFAACLLNRGFGVRFLISPGYRWMAEGCFDGMIHYSYAPDAGFSKLSQMLSSFWLPWRSCRKLFSRHPASGVLLASWHPMNVLLAGLAKAVCPGAPVMAWLHEPFKDEKKVYGAKAVIIYLVEFFQTLSLRYADIVILFSGRALRLFRKRYPNFRGLERMAPLPYRDECFQAEKPRRYISFLGRADRAKGIDLFFALVDRLGQDNLNFEFQIVTSSEIQRHLEALSPRARQKLRVVNRPQISDAELREGAAESLAVLALYKETTQSGLIPVALMQGTPLIGTDIEGITEWLKHGETGVIVSAEPTLEELKGAIDYVIAHFHEMTDHCRAAYLATFDDRNWDRQYGWLRGLLQE